MPEHVHLLMNEPAGILVAQFLTFPGMFLQQGPLFGGTQTTIWLWCFWHVGPALGILLFLAVVHGAHPRARVRERQHPFGSRTG